MALCRTNFGTMLHIFDTMPHIFGTMLHIFAPCCTFSAPCVTFFAPCHTFWHHDAHFWHHDATYILWPLLIIFVNFLLFWQLFLKPVFDPIDYFGRILHMHKRAEGWSYAAFFLHHFVFCSDWLPEGEHCWQGLHWHGSHHRQRIQLQGNKPGRCETFQKCVCGGVRGATLNSPMFRVGCLLA